MRVTGVVLDENSAPLADAAVVAELEGTLGFTGSTFSLADGSFAMDLSKPGEYILYAHKEESGYPNPKFAFYAKAAKDPLRFVASQGMPQRMVLKLGPKCGMLMGSAADAKSGKTLTAVTLRMAWKSDPKHWILTSLAAPFNTPVPPVPVSLEFGASGYEPWISPDEGLNVPLGEEHLLLLKLSPEKPHP